MCLVLSLCLKQRLSSCICPAPMNSSPNCYIFWSLEQICWQGTSWCLGREIQTTPSASACFQEGPPSSSGMAPQAGGLLRNAAVNYHQVAKAASACSCLLHPSGGKPALMSGYLKTWGWKASWVGSWFMSGSDIPALGAATSVRQVGRKAGSGRSLSCPTSICCCMSTGALRSRVALD